MERVIEKDRILLEARMLPRDRKLHKREVDIVRRALRALLDDPESGVSMAMVAGQIGYSSSVISEWLRGKYAGKVDLITHAVNLWMERHARRQQTRGRRDYVETWVCEAMAAVIRFAHRRERMAAIVAPSGAGKDMVIAHLAEDLGGYIIECHRKLTARELLNEIAMRIGLSARQTRGSAGSVLRRIVDKIPDRACTIFLNEAQQLSQECASVIRTIHDQTHVPIIMLGSSAIFEFIDDKASGGGQFSRRTIKCDIESKMRFEIDPDTGETGRRLYSRAEVRRFLDMKRVRMADDDAFQMLHQVACLIGHGTMGLLHEIVEGIADLNGNDAAITCELIAEQLRFELEEEADLVMGNIHLDEEDAPRAAIA